MPPLPESPYRLLVEGPDDQHSVIHLMARHGFDWDDESTPRPFVSPEGGIEKLLRSVSVALKGTYERIGIILDANSSLGDRWAQIRARASQIGLDLPESPAPGGTVVQGRQPGSRVGVWLMPDNSSSGTLESFLSTLVSAEHPIWIYAGQVTREARQRGARFPEKDHLKSVLHTWLAWQEEPGLPFGTALKAGIFETDREGALGFVAWFRNLFVEA
ncbi:MAG TPA: DUF3226 domain-containing protein [Thermoanaerobaculia bacterium]